MYVKNAKDSDIDDVFVFISKPIDLKSLNKGNSDSNSWSQDHVLSFSWVNVDFELNLSFVFTCT